MVRTVPFEVGEEAYYRPNREDFYVSVEINARRNAYGTFQYSIRPLSGKGQRWTTAAKLRRRPASDEIGCIKHEVTLPMRCCCASCEA